MTGAATAENRCFASPDAEEPISMERRCQVPGCRTVFTAPTLDELRCPTCRDAGRRAGPGGQSLYGCAAARCAGV
jgi:hypothetical protein